VIQPQALATALKAALGAGGSVNEAGAVEIQGQLAARVEKFLWASGQLTGVAREKSAQKGGAAAGTEEPLAVQTDRSYGPADRRAAAGKPRRLKERQAAKVVKLVSAPTDFSLAFGTWRRCPFNWLYCTGRCQYPPSDEEDEDEEGVGGCLDLASADEVALFRTGVSRCGSVYPASVVAV